MKVRLMFVSALTTVLWACSGDPVAPPPARAMLTPLHR